MTKKLYGKQAVVHLLVEMHVEYEGTGKRQAIAAAKDDITRQLVIETFNEHGWSKVRKMKAKVVPTSPDPYRRRGELECAVNEVLDAYVNYMEHLKIEERDEEWYEKDFGLWMDYSASRALLLEKFAPLPKEKAK